MKRLVSSLLLLTALAACGGDDNDSNGGPDTQAFTGIVSSDDGLSSGELLLEVAGSVSLRGTPTSPHLLATLNVSGTLVINGGAPIALTGTFDTETLELSVSGGGYSFNGVFDGDHGLEGTWTGPGGIGGTFVGTDQASATAYCGSYVTSTQDDSGTFSFVIGGTILRGTAVSSEDGSVIPLDGTVSSNNITIYFPGTTTALATGTRSGGDVSGTFDTQQGSTGTWAGSSCGS